LLHVPSNASNGEISFATSGSPVVYHQGALTPVAHRPAMTGARHNSSLVTPLAATLRVGTAQIVRGTRSEAIGVLGTTGWAFPMEHPYVVAQGELCGVRRVGVSWAKHIAARVAYRAHPVAWWEF
jgi:hypothetical protein